MRLKFWQTINAGDRNSPATRMFTTRRYPVYYLSIAKCGCTFLKNLFYALDHGVQHPAGNSVHAHEGDLIKATAKDAATIRESAYAFTVLRDPVDRFLSFYFDKIYADGPRNFPVLRARLAKTRDIDLSQGISAERHRRNALELLDWVSAALKKGKKGAGHHHWKRQSVRLRRADRLALERLTLDGLDQQLPALLSPVIPDITARMERITARNKTSRPVAEQAVTNHELIAAINRVYAKDREAFDEATQNWARRLPAEE